MKEQLALLRELQNIDLELDEILRQKNDIQSSLEENTGFLSKLVEDLEGQKAELDEIRAMQRQRKGELDEVQEQLTSRQKRLRDVGTSKEYNAVEKEIEVLKKSAEQTEEQLLHLVEVIESTEKSIGEKEGKITQLREGIAVEETEAGRQLNALDQNIERLNTRQVTARTEVNKRVISKYDFIRSRRSGLAVVAAKDAHCEGCYMSLPPQQFIEIQRGDTLEICPSCNRILYFWEDAQGARSNSAQTAEV